MGAGEERKLSDSNAGMTPMKGEGEGRIVWKGQKGFRLQCSAESFSQERGVPKQRLPVGRVLHWMEWAITIPPPYSVIGCKLPRER